MAAPTEHLGLARPEDGSDHWGAGYREAMTVIDAAIADLQEQAAEEGTEPPVFIQPSQPSAPGPYFWIETGVAGTGFRLWFHDGEP